MAHISEIDPQLSEQQGVRATLAHRVHCRHDDDRPDRAITDMLEAAHPERASRA